MTEVIEKLEELLLRIRVVEKKLDSLIAANKGGENV